MIGLRISGTFVWLTALWLLLWNDLSVANVVAGLAVAIVVLGVARLPRLGRTSADERARIDPVALVTLSLYTLFKLVQANLVLAWEILTPRNTINIGILAVPLRTDSEVAMMVVANVITVTPGTVTIEAQGTPPVLYVNVLHLHDLESIRRDLLRIEELSVRAFGSRRARAQLAGEVAS